MIFTHARRAHTKDTRDSNSSKQQNAPTKESKSGLVFMNNAQIGKKPCAKFVNSTLTWARWSIFRYKRHD